MKSFIYTFLICLFFSINSSHAQTIPNGGMENWLTYQLFETPPPYQTTNLQSYLLGGDYAVTQVTGVTGSAARLESVELDGEIIAGVLIQGDLDNVTGGSPITTTPDSVRVSLRYDIPMGDTAFVALAFSNSGVLIGLAQHIIEGTQNTFEQVTFDVPPILGVPDAVQLIVSSSNFDNPVLGGFLEIDDIILTETTDELPNHDFEMWESEEYDDLEIFSSLNGIQALFDLEPMVTQTSDAYAGSSAVRIENVETLDFDGGDTDTLGFIYTGDLSDEAPTLPLAATPQWISGWYKYDAVNNDSATIYLSFTKYNPAIEESEVVAEFAFLLGEATSYTSFSFPLTFSEIPDSFNIGIASGNVEFDEAQLGSVLILDELSFDLVEGTKLPIFSDALEVYPNPASDFIYIKMDQKISQPESIELIDVTGKSISWSNLEGLIYDDNLLRIDVNNNPTGMYYYKIVSAETIYTGKVMIGRN